MDWKQIMKFKNFLFPAIISLVVIIVIICSLSTVKQPDDASSELIYPEYSSKLETKEVSMTAGVISDHRVFVTMTNHLSQGTSLYYDSSFELINSEGAVIPIDHNPLLQLNDYDDHPQVAYGQSVSFGVTLSNLYSSLPAGKYRLLKVIYIINPDQNSTRTVRYVSAAFELAQDMQPCEFLAAPFDPLAFRTPQQPVGISSGVVSYTSRLGCRILIENNSNSSISPLFCNGNFSVYREINGEYFPIPTNGSVRYKSEELAPLTSGSSCEYDIVWESIYGALPKGRYLLVIQVEKEDGNNGNKTLIFTELDLAA